MKILFEYDGVLPVVKYGGTERLIYWIMKELKKLGHEPCLIAREGSSVKEIGAELIIRRDADFRHQIPDNVDLVHMFYPPPPLELPTLVTIGGNGKSGEVFHLNSVFVSKNHAQNHNSLSFVHNALDLDEYPFTPPRKNEWKDFFFLAKASWKVKNLKGCVAACKASKKYLHVAGGRGFSLSNYIRYYGMLEQAKKPEFIARMDGLLFPVRWNEPFGLAIIEAFAFGKPVIGTPFGSLPELITKDVGIICKSPQELLEALATPRHFDPYQIRKYVEDQFSAQKMTESYLSLYQRILRGESLNSTQPFVQNGYDPGALLDF